MVNTMQGDVLVIGSMSTVTDGSYEALVANLKTQSPHVRAEMLDRVLDGAALLETETYSRALVHLSLNDLQTRLVDLVGAISGALRSGSRLEVNVVGLDEQGRELCKRAVQNWQDVSLDQTQLVAVKPSAQNGLPPLNGTNGTHKRPASDIGATQDTPVASTSVPLRLKPRSGTKKASLWALSQAPFTAALIDPSTLLSPEDLERRETIQRPDCDVKRTKKACKNCTCGLKEILLQEEDDLPSSMKAQTVAPSGAIGAVNLTGQKVVSTGAVTSSCGSCYLGDAFRCSSCPYLGLPAFEPGQKVEVSLMDDDI